MNLTITSSQQHPADFSCNVLDALDLDEGYEVAVTRVFHAPIFNVTERNNKFSLLKENSHIVNGVKINSGKTLIEHFIPPGYYATTCDVLVAIYNELEESRKRGHNGSGVGALVLKKPKLTYSSNGSETITLKLVDSGVKFLVDRERDGDNILLFLLGYCFDDEIGQLTVNNYPFEISPIPGFLYSNIVENSYINEQRSRLLSIVPVYSKRGYNCYEFTNPIYSPLSAHSFVDVNFKLLDIHGDALKMDPVYTTWYGTNTVIYPTIIMLHIRRML